MSILIILTLLDIVPPSRGGVAGLAHSVLKALMVLPAWSHIGWLGRPLVGAIVGAGFLAVCLIGFSGRLTGDRAILRHRLRRTRTP